MLLLVLNKTNVLGNCETEIFYNKSVCIKYILLDDNGNRKRFFEYLQPDTVVKLKGSYKFTKIPVQFCFYVKNFSPNNYVVNFIFVVLLKFIVK